MPIRSARSIPFLRGTEPTRSAQSMSLKPTLRSVHGDAFEGVHAGFDLDQVQGHGLFGAEQGTGGNAEQKSVANVAGGAGHRHADGVI